MKSIKKKCQIYILALLACLLPQVMALAETSDLTNFQVKGMHCSGCVRTLQKKICNDFQLEGCQVSLTDSKKELGKISFRKNDAVDLEKIRKKIEEAGYEVIESK